MWDAGSPVNAMLAEGWMIGERLLGGLLGELCWWRWCGGGEGGRWGGERGRGGKRGREGREVVVAGESNWVEVKVWYLSRETRRQARVKGRSYCYEPKR